MPLDKLARFAKPQTFDCNTLASASDATQTRTPGVLYDGFGVLQMRIGRMMDRMRLLTGTVVAVVLALANPKPSDWKGP